MKVLLLNPPGRKNYLRDYYCSTVSKSDYYYHPVDLLYLSGSLFQEHEVEFLDALAKSFSQSRTIQEIEKISPDVLICLISSPSFDEDHEFLKKIKHKDSEIRIIGTGDVVRELQAESFSAMPYLDACLFDFSTDDILKYLRGSDGQPISNIIYRYQDQLLIGEEKHVNGSFSIPVPRFELFPKNDYSFPFVIQSPFMTVLTDFGCPYGCTFCPVSSLGFKMRSVSEVIQELKLLWKRGFREVHFRDQTFGVNERRMMELCETIRKELPDLTWSCFSRVDLLNEARIRIMSEAGCHTVIVGIEFDNDEWQKIFKKNINRQQMFSTIKICHQYKMRVVGTFIIGLPGQTEESILETGEFAKALNLDYVSFNLATPRLGTTWRRELIASGIINKEKWKMDTVDGSDAWINPTFGFSKLGQLRHALEKKFYLSPASIVKRIVSARSPVELFTQFRNGFGLFRGE